MSSILSNASIKNSSATKNEAPLKEAPLKIAIIAHSLYPIAQPYAGGLEMITQLLCDELVARGHDVLLYAHKDSQTQADRSTTAHDSRAV